MKSAKAEGLIALRAAIYARKSTDDNDREAVNKSVTRQIEHAKEYARKKGWTVDDEYVFSDDGISGAEFENRRDFARLIASLPKKGKRPFDVLIMRELSRLGRDQQRTVFYLAHIRDCGVKIWYYLEDQEELLDSPEQVLMLSVKSYAAEVQRLKAGQQSREALVDKAKAGYNAGGVVYGYDNVPVLGASGTKSHTEYRKNEEQAQAIRTMFQMYADGYGSKVIAYCVNGNGARGHLLKRY